MSHCWWIGSLEKLTRDIDFPAQTPFAAKGSCWWDVCTLTNVAPSLICPLPEPRGCMRHSPLCCRCKLCQEVTPACYALWTVNQSDIFRQNSPSSRYETTAAPAWDKLYVDMILFCQYVIDICTLPTSNNKECKGPLCLYQRSEVNQSYLERSAKVSRLLHIHKAVFYPYFSFPYSIVATVFA